MSIHYQSIRCSCNYDQVPGAELASYLIPHNITNIPPNGYGKINNDFCWYPGTPQGIRELIAASNSLYLNREKLFLHNARYQGWTECSASPNLQDENMIDALVIELPLLKKSKTGNDYSNIADLKDDMVRQLKENLEGYAHLKLPVLMLREKRGMGEEECSMVSFSMPYLIRRNGCERTHQILILVKSLKFLTTLNCIKSPRSDNFTTSTDNR